jgi:hypothetical protein
MIAILQRFNFLAMSDAFLAFLYIMNAHLVSDIVDAWSDNKFWLWTTDGLVAARFAIDTSSSDTFARFSVSHVVVQVHYTPDVLLLADNEGAESSS